MITSTHAVAAALLALGATLSACGTKGGRDEYTHDADTGAAAPATVPTVNNPAAPDSTSGMSARTGKPGTAGVRQGGAGDVTGASKSRVDTGPARTKSPH